MKAINPYLNFNGNTEEAFLFYQSVFGGQFTSLQRFKDVPQKDQDQGGIKPEEGEKIMHISLPIGKQMVLMATDSPESMGKVSAGNNFHLCIETDSKEEAETLFAKLSAGGAVTMPMTDTFWGAYYGILKDKFGIGWMINFTKPT